MVRTMEHVLTKPPSLSVMRISGSTVPIKLEGTLHALQHIFRTEGIAGLFAGLSPTMVIAVPSTVLYYVTYDMMLSSGREHLSQWESVLPLAAGSSARIVAATATSPLELIRTRMQNDGAHKRSIISTFEDAIGNGGYRALRRGIGATLARDVPFSAIYWTTYESTQRLASERVESTRIQRAFVCGAISGSLAATITTPFDVVKTLHQVQSVETHASIASTLREIYQSRGVPGLFTGLGARLARVAPSCAIMISCYELGKLRLGID
ncbi:hypothetical protein PINS_up002369 [Pythium insidiosum]|nr:hypothetical protein PINS_up002369 [Pythium insidiosum]